VRQYIEQQNRPVQGTARPLAGLPARAFTTAANGGALARNPVAPRRRTPRRARAHVRCSARAAAGGHGRRRCVRGSTGVHGRVGCARCGGAQRSRPVHTSYGVHRPRQMCTGGRGWVVRAPQGSGV